MKTLAPFVLVCLALLTLLAWELHSVTRDATTGPESPTNDGPLPPSHTDVALSAEESEASQGFLPADTALRHEPEEPGKNPTSPATAPTTQMVGHRPRAVPTLATQPAVHWATDARQRRARQQFVKLREILVADPRNEAALEAALELARGLLWHNEACDLLARLVRLRPEDAALRFELATGLMRLERWLEAIPQLRFVIERQPENARAWYNLAISHQALAHLHDARATWNRVIELMPRNPDVYAYRGEALLDLRAWSAAAADFEAALRLDPDSVGAAMNLSLALSKLGRLAEAREALLPVLAQRPQYVPVLNRLAEIAWRLCETDPQANEPPCAEVVNCCQRSLAADADQPQIEALLKRASTGGD